MNINLEQLVRDYKIFVDTCSFMHPEASMFFNKTLAPMLLNFKKKIIIPDKVIVEINRLQNSNKKDTSTAAESAAKIMQEYQNFNLVDVRGEDGDPFTDNVFHYVFSKFRTKHNLAIITQDTELTKIILSLKEAKAIQSSKKLIALKLDKYGNLKEWNDNQSFTGMNKSYHQNTFEKVEKFQICSKPRQQKDYIHKTTKIPEEGYYVNAGEYGRIRLIDKIGEGGEGKIYSTDSGHACKIYLKDRITENRFQKINLMVGRKLNIPGVCWPLATINNSNKEFVGYLMPMANGKPMQKCMFVKPLLEKYFPHWKRVNLVNLSITWLEKTVALHSFNILMGDVNPLNILIKTDQELYLVDTDSYQIQDFPCPVGMVNFTAPEIQGKDFATFMRTLEHEYFAIATLLFMILLPGKPPYSHQGGEDPLDNIKKGEFSYPFRENTNKKTPDGPWRFIWSNLPYKTKEAFYNCFTNQNRINAHQWLILMKIYKDYLEKRYLDPDGESEKLFPARFKSVSTYAQEKYDAENGDYVNYKCNICGKQFQVNSRQAERLKDIPSKICRDCLIVLKMKREESRRNRNTGTFIYCVDCGEQFLFSDGEKEYYNKIGLTPPKRCKDCRVVHKEIGLTYMSSDLIYNESKFNKRKSRTVKPKPGKSLLESLFEIIFD